MLTFLFIFVAGFSDRVCELPVHQVLELPRQLPRVQVHRHPDGRQSTGLVGLDHVSRRST